MDTKLFDKLSDTQLKQQALQVLNYAPDTIQVDTTSLAYSFYNLFNIFKIDNERQFNLSQKNSLDCILGKNSYSDCIDSLVMGDKKSFIIAPLATVPHISCCIIYKSAKNSDFNCIIINKKANSPRMYMKYSIPSENISNIVDCLGYAPMQFTSIDEFLKVFDENASKAAILDFNCALDNSLSESTYITELEAALNYSYSKAFLFKYAKTIDNFQIRGPFNVPEIHTQFLDNLKKRRPELSDDIDYLISIKNQNKKFSGMFKIDHPEYKVEEFFFKIAFLYDETNDITSCLKKIDLNTLSSNFDFIYKLCKKYELHDYIDMLDVLNPLLSDSEFDLSDFTDNLQNFKALLPNAIPQLAATYSVGHSLFAFDKTNTSIHIINNMADIIEDFTNAPIPSNDYILDEDEEEELEYFTPYVDNDYHEEKFSTPYIKTNNTLDETYDEMQSPKFLTPLNQDNNLDYIPISHDDDDVSEGYTLYYDDSSNPDSPTISSDESYVGIDCRELPNILDSLFIESLRVCNDAITLDSKNAFCEYEKGVNFLYLDEIYNAQIAFSKASTLCPTNTYFRTMYAVSLGFDNKPELAISQLDEVLSIEPNNEIAMQLITVISEPANQVNLKEILQSIYTTNYSDLANSLASLVDSNSIPRSNSLYSFIENSSLVRSKSLGSFESLDSLVDDNSLFSSNSISDINSLVRLDSLKSLAKSCTVSRKNSFENLDNTKDVEKKENKQIDTKDINL